MIGRILRLQILQNTLIFSGSSIVNRAIPFLLAPIITQYLAPADYGVVANFISLLTVLVVFTGVNTNGILEVQYFNVDREYFKLQVGNIIIVLVAFSALTLLAVWLLSPWLSELLELPVHWLITGVLCAVAMFLTNINLGLWQLEKKAKSYATFTLVETVINIGLSLFFIIVWKMTWDGRLYGIAFSIIAFGGLSLLMIHLRGMITLRFNKLLFSEALAFGLPLIPHNLGGWLRTGVNIVIITHLLGSAYTGIYNLGSQLAMVVFFVGNGFTKALTPVIYEKLAAPSKSSDLRLVQINYLFFAGILLFALATSLLSPYVIKTFFKESYHGSTAFIPWLSFSFAFFSMYFAVVTYLLHYKKTIALSIISTVSGLLNLLICYTLVQFIGAEGAAIASFVSFAFMFVVVLIYAQHLHPLPWGRFGEVIGYSDRS